MSIKKIHIVSKLYDTVIGMSPLRSTHISIFPYESANEKNLVTRKLGEGKNCDVVEGSSVNLTPLSPRPEELMQQSFRITRMLAAQATCTIEHRSLSV